MNGDSYNITVAEGGFILHVNRASRSEEGSASTLGGTYEPYVFADSSALINYLQNELAGSN